MICSRQKQLGLANLICINRNYTSSNLPDGLLDLVFQSRCCDTLLTAHFYLNRKSEVTHRPDKRQENTPIDVGNLRCWYFFHHQVYSVVNLLCCDWQFFSVNWDIRLRFAFRGFCWLFWRQLLDLGNQSFATSFREQVCIAIKRYRI